MNNEHRQYKVEYVCRIGTHPICDELRPPSKIFDFKQWLDEILERIPDEYQFSTEIDIGAIIGYDGPETTYEISYRRPETDEEMNARLKKISRETMLQDSNDRQTYERLKKKFEKENQ